jgi:hypothetical protein
MIPFSDGDDEIGDRLRDANKGAMTLGHTPGRRPHYVRVLAPLTVLSVGSATIVGVLLFAIGTFMIQSQPRNADITLSAVREGRLLNVAGKASLPDGARLTVVAYDDAAFTQDGSGAPHSSRLALVHDGSYEIDVDVAALTSGDLFVVVTFVVGSSQPREVTELFGPRGEDLVGPQVHEDTDGRRSLQVATFVKGSTSR